MTDPQQGERWEVVDGYVSPYSTERRQYARRYWADSFGEHYEDFGIDEMVDKENARLASADAPDHECATGWSIAHVYPWQEGQQVDLVRPTGESVRYVRADLAGEAPSAAAPTVAPDISNDGVKWTCFLCHAENISGHLCKECHRPGRAIAPDAQAGEWTIEPTRFNSDGMPREYRVIYWQGSVQSRIYVTMLREDAEWLLSLTAALREARDENTELERERVRLRDAWAEAQERAAQAERERDEYSYQASLASNLPAANARAEAAEARVERLAQALHKYGDHSSGCIWKLGGDRCSCGLYAALTEQPAGDQP